MPPQWSRQSVPATCSGLPRAARSAAPSGRSAARKAIAFRRAAVGGRQREPHMPVAGAIGEGDAVRREGEDRRRIAVAERAGALEVLDQRDVRAACRQRPVDFEDVVRRPAARTCCRKPLLQKRAQRAEPVALDA